MLFAAHWTEEEMPYDDSKCGMQGWMESIQEG